MKQIRIWILIGSIVLTASAQAQRLSDKNTLGWLAYTGTFKVAPKAALHTEFQWRRVNRLEYGQQNLYRTGINYALRKEVSLNAGYAFAKTFAYGDYPVAAAFPEHRAFQQLVLKNGIGKVDISHRFTLEQRFLGSRTNADAEYNWQYLNRMRYRLRTDVPVTKDYKGNTKWSFVLQDEVFIGWGKTIGANVFDQNRIGVLTAYKVSPAVKLEGGYLNQILQQGRQVNNQSVFQYNHGFFVAAHVGLDLQRKQSD